MEKEVRFTQKHVDESWKEGVAQTKGDTNRKSGESLPIIFSDFVASLGVQALIKLGELKAPDEEKSEIDLEGARETIELLLMIKEKTKGNLTSEEEKLLSSLIADLQMKFVQHKGLHG